MADDTSKDTSLEDSELKNPEQQPTDPKPTEAEGADSNTAASDEQDTDGEAGKQPENGAATGQGDGDKKGDKPVEGESEEERRKKAHDEYKARERRRQEQEEADRALESATNEWVEEAGDDETKREVRELRAENFLRKVKENQQTLTSDRERAVRDFPVFNPDSEDGRQNLLDALDSFAPYLETTQVKKADGSSAVVVTGYSKPLYKHLEKEAKKIERIQNASALEGQKRAQKELVHAEPEHSTSGRNGKQSNKDDKELSADEYAKKHGLARVRA